jgi:hypothetical protein
VNNVGKYIALVIYKSTTTTHFTFFETFPVVLIDGDGIVRADVP